MSELPIIMSAPMILALLAGTKRMTRRLAWKHEPQYWKGNIATLGSPSPWQRVKTGDRLWVRENWYAAHDADDVPPRDMTPEWRICPAVDWNYAASGIHGKLRVAMHMPRWASRLTLLVTATKIEKLQEISNEDAEAEGVECDMSVRSFRDHFAKLWDTLHGPGAWELSPEVVALTFIVHQQNIDTLPKAEVA